jgi:hypothetical protein
LKSDKTLGVSFVALYLSNISCASIADTSGFLTLNASLLTSTTVSVSPSLVTLTSFLSTLIFFLSLINRSSAFLSLTLSLFFIRFADC